MSATHRNIPTPHPAFTALKVTVREESLTALMGRLPQKGVLYKDFAPTIFAKDYNSNYADFIYTGQGEMVENGMTLYFGPNMTDEEINTPFNTLTSTKPMFWDTVLKGIKFVPVTTYPVVGQSIVNDGVSNILVKSYITRYRLKEAYIQGGHYNTKFTVREYFSPKPFAIPHRESPVPAPVSFQLPTGERYSFNSCLHKRLRLQSLLAGFAISDSAGAVSNQAEVIEGQLFPETNFTEWDGFYREDDQKQIAGGYHRISVWVDPPDEPDVTLSVS